MDMNIAAPIISGLTPFGEEHQQSMKITINLNSSDKHVEKVIAPTDPPINSLQTRLEDLDDDEDDWEERPLTVDVESSDRTDKVENSHVTNGAVINLMLLAVD